MTCQIAWMVMVMHQYASFTMNCSPTINTLYLYIYTFVLVCFVFAFVVLMGVMHFLGQLQSTTCREGVCVRCHSGFQFHCRQGNRLVTWRWRCCLMFQRGLSVVWMSSVHCLANHQATIKHCSGKPDENWGRLIGIYVLLCLTNWLYM